MNALSLASNAYCTGNLNSKNPHLNKLSLVFVWVSMIFLSKWVFFFFGQDNLQTRPDFIQKSGNVKLILILKIEKNRMYIQVYCMSGVYLYINTYIHIIVTKELQSSCFRCLLLNIVYKYILISILGFLT